MSNLTTVPKNGTLSSRTSNANYPNASNWLDDIFTGDFPSLFSTDINAVPMPKVNIKETADAFILEMAVPGFKRSDFQIELDNVELSISTEMREENESNQENYTRREFGYTSFKRAFTLPETVDDDKINANYEDGILSILLPKKEEAKQKPLRKIKIS